ncbi:MAG: signal peptidase [Arthrobacter sp.]|nr:signal peptidase [Arthrobacter sp.]
MSTATAPRPGHTVGAAGAATPGRQSTGRRAVSRAVAVISSVMVVLALAAFLFLAVGPRILGYQTATMLTGSMSPLINPGDVVVTAPVHSDQLAVGDIITYHIPVDDHRVETHRIVEVLANSDGSTAVRTKGDANDGVDPWTATLVGGTAYRHVATVPYLGHAIRALRDPTVKAGLMYGAPALLVAGTLAAIWRKNPEGETDG